MVETVSPATRQARLGIHVVEDILLELRSLSSWVDRRIIVRDVEKSLELLHALRDSPLHAPDHLSILDEAAGQIRKTCVTVMGHDLSHRSEKMNERLLGVARVLEHAREAAIDRLVGSQTSAIRAEVVGRQAETVPALLPFAVSVGVPSLHTLEREPLRARVDVSPEDFTHEPGPDPEEDPLAAIPAADPEPPAFDEDDEVREIDKSKRLELLVPLGADDTMVSGIDGELAMLKKAARSCLEDIGASENLRSFRQDSRYQWAAQRRFEQRMLTSIDAFVGLGQPFFMGAGNSARFGGLDILDVALQYGGDAVAMDPFRAFATTLALCSVAGTDTVRAAVLALRQSRPFTYRAQAHAFALAPNPAVEPALEDLSRDEDFRLVEVALDALYERGSNKLSTLLPLLHHAQESIRVRAARGMGVSEPRLVAIEHLVTLLEDEIDDDVVCAAAEALVFLGSAAGVEAARERLRESVEEDMDMVQGVHARFMQLLAIAGNVSDGPLLQAAYLGGPGEAMALGFHGDFRSVDTLLDALKPGTGEVVTGVKGQHEAAMAILRITGIPIHRPNPQLDFYQVVTDTLTIHTLLNDVKDNFNPGTRYRFGQPWSGLHSVAELEADNVPIAARRLAAIELGMLLREQPIPMHALAARQADMLARQRASVVSETEAKRTRFLPGIWPAV